MTYSNEPENIIKVGETKKHPQVRADGLSKTIRGEFTVQWCMKVPDSKKAEKLAHGLLNQYADKKEYFVIEVDKAVEIIKDVICKTYAITDPECEEGPILKRIAKRSELLSRAKEQAIRLLKLQEAERLQPIESKTEHNTDVRLSMEDRLSLFVESLYNDWREKNNSIDGITTREISDEGETYAYKQMQKLGYTSIFTPYNYTPIDIVGIKWRGYFWHMMTIKVKTSTTNDDYSPSKQEINLVNKFIKFLSDSFANAEPFQEFSTKPVAFSVGLARVKNHRPNQSRCTLKKSETFSWYWINISKEKEDRIRELIEEAHSLR